MRDPETDQRLNLIESDYLPFALSFETDDVDGSVASLTEAGCTVQDSGVNEANGFQWAVVRDTSGLPILLGSVSDSPHGQRRAGKEIAGRIGKFADAMVAVPDVAKAVTFWTETMGFETTEQGTDTDFVTLRDSLTGQHLCLFSGDFTPWAISIQTSGSSFEQSVASFGATNGEVINKGQMDSGFQWALCKDASGLPLVIHTNDLH